MIGELIKEALFTLRTNLLRTVLTMIGIILGVGAVVAIMTMGRSAYMTAEKSIQDSGYGSIQINHNFAAAANEAMPINQSLLTMLRSAKIEGVSSYQPQAYGSGDTAFNSEDDSIFVSVIYQNEADVIDLKFLAGGPFSQEDVEAKSQVVIVDDNLANKLFGGVQEAVGGSIRTANGFYYRIIGVTKGDAVINLGGNTVERGKLYLPMSMVELEPWFQTYGYDYISVNVEMGADYDRISMEIENFLMETYGFESAEEMTLSVENVKDMMAEVNMFMTAFSLGLSLIAAISLIVGGVGIMNIMLVSVTERTKEIGLMKALGAEEKDIVFQFLVESIVMTVCGGLVGAVGGIGLSALIIKLANTFGEGILPEFAFVIDGTAILVSMVVSILIGLVFGSYPAKKAAKLDPVEALRRD